jgi:hypothetical protein
LKEVEREVVEKKEIERNKQRKRKITFLKSKTAFVFVNKNFHVKRVAFFVVNMLHDAFALNLMKIKLDFWNRQCLQNFFPRFHDFLLHYRGNFIAFLLVLDIFEQVTPEILKLQLAHLLEVQFLNIVVLFFVQFENIFDE